MKSGINEILEWPTVREMCKRLNVSTNYGYGLILNGKIAAQKICGQWRVSPDAIAKRLKEKSRGQ